MTELLDRHHVGTAVDTREGLAELARMWNRGDLDQSTETWMAEAVRVWASALWGADDAEVMTAFVDLAEEIRKLDDLDAGQVSWCEIVADAEGSDRDGQAFDAQTEKVVALLAEMVGVSS